PAPGATPLAPTAPPATVARRCGTRPTAVRRRSGWAGAIADVTDERERERALERQNEHLETFARVVSHDLRNPLNVALGRVEQLWTEQPSDELGDVRRSLERIETILEDMRALTTSGQLVTDVEPFDLAELARYCWANVEGGAALEVDLDGAVIVGDESRTAQLLENLFRNAVEHGGEDVTVTVGRLDGGFSVADDGAGIPAQRREELLARDLSTGEGRGYGLHIVRSVARGHGWDVSLTESDAGGARFEFRDVTFE
ncbi:MAG: sensor histidine kinase, partial [Halobacteriaceae archaeon]